MFRKTPSGETHQEKDASVPAAISDIGCERELNEDRYAVIDSAVGRAWVVCDGMGGVSGGDLAAQLAIDAIRRNLSSVSDEELAEALSTAIQEANRVIVLRRQNPPFDKMGTTVAAVMIQRDEVVLATAGDSRVYLARNGEVKQLSVDHTYVQDLVDRGSIAAEDALSHPQAHVLTRCLGAEPRLELDMSRHWIWPVADSEPEDLLILCSDGLYSLVSDAEIGATVQQFSPQESCVQLVELAKQRGGFDNITVAILPIGGILRDTPPEKRRVVSQKQVSFAPRSPAFLSSLSFGARIGVMVSLCMLGSIVGSFIVLMKLVSA